MFLETVEKAGINGVIAGVASVALFGSRATVIAPMTSMTMPLYCLIFLGGAASSLVADGVHMFMKDEIPVSKKANDRTSLVAGLAINAIVFAGLLQFSDNNIAADFGRMNALAVGAASEFFGSSAYTYLKEKMYI
jgi:hypothetical protein